MFSDFNAQLAAGNVYRGAYDNPDASSHYGAAYGGKIHFDPSGLDAAAAGNSAEQTELAVSALHELLHVIGYHHTDPTWVDHKDYYAEHPFSRLNPGPNSCIKR